MTRYNETDKENKYNENEQTEKERKSNTRMSPRIRKKKITAERPT
jgi:hypothetical protein